jgi:uncharacterized Tic20 family protein
MSFNKIDRTKRQVGKKFSILREYKISFTVFFSIVFIFGGISSKVVGNKIDFQQMVNIGNWTIEFGLFLILVAMILVIFAIIKMLRGK